jgi:hypothetical protein
LLLVAQTPGRSWVIGAGVLLLSAMVLASNDDRLVISPADGQLLTDEMYERAEGWREPPMFESEWRAPEPEPRTRIRFGYDSAYEELRARDPINNSFVGTNLGEPQPNTLFRMEF